MPATNAVFLVGLIGVPFDGAFAAGAWTVMAMAVSLSWIACSSGLGVAGRGMARFGERDRDQGQAQVACFLNQAVQRGLVRYGAVNDRGAVAAAGNGQSVEPGGPPAIEVALEADLILPGASMMVGRYLAHGAPLLVLAWLDLRRHASVPGSDRKL